MLSTEYFGLLILAPLAGIAAWYAATRFRRGRIRAGAFALISAALFVVALAGLRTGTSHALRVFLFDISASTRGRTAAWAGRVYSSAQNLNPSDQVAVIAFGADAAVVLPPTRVDQLPIELPDLTGVDQDGTDFNRVIRLGQGVFAPGLSGDLVMLTDGCDHGEQPPASVGRAVHSLTLSPPTEKDAWVEAVRAPPFASAGEEIVFEILIGASEPMRGTLILLLNGREIARPSQIDIVESRSVLVRRVALPKAGLYTLTARLQSEADTVSENNEAAAAIRVRGPLRVAYLGDESESALYTALAASSALEVVRQQPDALPITNTAMLGLDVVVLDNVSRERLGNARIEWLRRLVMDAGGGLVVFGGNESFGPGGYAGTPLADLLPVDPDPERRAATPSAVAVVVDRSGSMAELIGGRQKIEFVREAILRAGIEFGTRRGDRSDELSVIAFNQTPQVLLRAGRVGEPKGAAELRDAVAQIVPSGQTDIQAAIDAAVELIRFSSLRRHIILVSDGLSRSVLDGDKISRKLKSHAIVLSILATDPGSADPQKMNAGLIALEAAAKETKGRYVPLRDISELPGAMARSSRAIAGSLVREAPLGENFNIAISPGLSPLAVTAPKRARGYVLTGARPEAPPLASVDGAPLVAVWQRGLGRVAVCTTSLDAWAVNWVKEAPEFFPELVRWAGAGSKPQDVNVWVEARGRNLHVDVWLAEPLEGPEPVAALLHPDGTVMDIPLHRAGRYRYTTTARATGRGTYLVTVRDKTTGNLLGEGHIYLGYSAEWMPGADTSAARRLSHLTGGTVLKSPADLPPLQRDSVASTAYREISWIILLVAAALFLAPALRS